MRPRELARSIIMGAQQARDRLFTERITCLDTCVSERAWKINLASSECCVSKKSDSSRMQVPRGIETLIKFNVNDEYEEGRYLSFQQLTLQCHAVSFFYHFTLQYHKVAQHAVSYFPAVNTSVSRGVLFVTTSDFSITKQPACSVFFVTSHFSVTQ